eukprot:m.57025 g.57025  ORF g.57025 m.57025 type:complete len:441 (+) comp9333_c0_seq3:23-1345(+)
MEESLLTLALSGCYCACASPSVGSSDVVVQFATSQSCMGISVTDATEAECPSMIDASLRGCGRGSYLPHPNGCLTWWNGSALMAVLAHPGLPLGSGRTRLADRTPKMRKAREKRRNRGKGRLVAKDVVDEISGPAAKVDGIKASLLEARNHRAQVKSRIADDRRLATQLRGNIKQLRQDLDEAISAPVAGGVDPTLWLSNELLQAILSLLLEEKNPPFRLAMVCHRWRNATTAVLKRLLHEPPPFPSPRPAHFNGFEVAGTIKFDSCKDTLAWNIAGGGKTVFSEWHQFGPVRIRLEIAFRLYEYGAPVGGGQFNLYQHVAKDTATGALATVAISLRSLRAGRSILKTSRFRIERGAVQAQRDRVMTICPWNLFHPSADYFDITTLAFNFALRIQHNDSDFDSDDSSSDDSSSEDDSTDYSDDSSVLDSEIDPDDSSDDD